MKAIVIYASKHGTVLRVAEKIAVGLGGETQILPISKCRKLEVENYDLVVIGGSIHAGNIQRGIKRFIRENLIFLKMIKVALFICCMEEGESAENQLRNAFPEELLAHAIISDYLGGEFNFDRMNFLERAIIKKISGTTESVSKLKEEKIQAFIRKLKEEL